MRTTPRHYRPDGQRDRQHSGRPHRQPSGQPGLRPDAEPTGTLPDDTARALRAAQRRAAGRRPAHRRPGRHGLPAGAWWMAGLGGTVAAVGLALGGGLWVALPAAVRDHTDTVISAVLLSVSLAAVWRMSGED